jgi:PAS domain S-box-containing protein
MEGQRPSPPEKFGIPSLPSRFGAIKYAYAATFRTGGREVALKTREDKNFHEMSLALWQDPSFLLRLLDSVPNPLFYKTPEGRYLGCNRAYEEYWGLSRNALIGRTAFDIMPEEEARLHHENDLKLLGGASDSLSYEAQNARPGRDPIWFILRKSLVRDANGTVQVILGVLTDITDRRKAEDALKESEERYRSIFENAVEGIFQSTPEGRFISVNPAFSKLCGYSSPEELVSEMDDIAQQYYVNRQDRQRFLTLIENKGFAENIEHQIRRKDGGTLWLSLNARAVRDNSGKTLYYEGTAIDITEHKKAEEALRESEERYRTAIEHSNDAVSIVQGSNQIYVNQRFLVMFGFRNQSEVINSEPFKNVHPDDRAKVAEINMKRRAGEPVPSRYEFKGMRTDGTVIFVEVSVATVAYHGEPVSLAYLRDVTERKMMEGALRESEERLKSIIEGSPIPQFVVDRNHVVLHWNTALEEWSGIKAEEVMGTTDHWKAFYEEERPCLVDLLVDSDAVSIPRWYRAKFATSALVKEAYEAVDFFPRQGKWLYFTAAAIRDSRGNITGGVETLEDVTERKRLESQLLQTQKMDAIGQLAGGIAHDFNNILSVIIGSSSLLRMRMDSNDPLNSYVNQISAAAEKAAQLTQSLLIFSRKQIMNMQPIELNDVVKGMKGLLSRLISEDIEFESRLTQQPLAVMADRVQIEQVLINLITNARDAIQGTGLISVETGCVIFDDSSVKAHALESPGMYGTLAVADTGSGIDDATKEHIFDPFFTTKGLGKGTGLGLSIVYGIVKQHGGYVEVDSTPEKGTRFTIYLPLVGPETTTIEEPLAALLPRGSETVMVAEDDPTVRSLTREILESHGYTVLEAVDGEEALKVFLQHRDSIDLLILDVVMPRKNGREVYDQVRQWRPETKVIFCSGYADDTVIQKGISTGEFDFIAKPVTPTNMLLTVRKVLDRD